MLDFSKLKNTEKSKSGNNEGKGKNTSSKDRREGCSNDIQVKRVWSGKSHSLHESPKIQIIGMDQDMIENVASQFDSSFIERENEKVKSGNKSREVDQKNRCKSSKIIRNGDQYRYQTRSGAGEDW